MALIKCPECGKKVSDQVDNCPKCGYPISSIDRSLNSFISETPKARKTKNSAKRKIKVIISFTLIGIILVVSAIILLSKPIQIKYNIMTNKWDNVITLINKNYNQKSEYLLLYSNTTVVIIHDVSFYGKPLQLPDATCAIESKRG